ncbi:hypothetical protein SAMN04487913_103294 [Arthrobacter sp. ok362]|nr:hypothetical protein SAMN04487913_103294 [Arthrobacter sp. ok362]
MTGVPASASGHFVLFVSEVFVHLRFQGVLQDIFREPVQQPARAHEVDALLSGLGQELLRQLLLIHISRHGSSVSLMIGPSRQAQPTCQPSLVQQSAGERPLDPDGIQLLGT